MANIDTVKISQLPEALVVSDSDAILVVQGRKAKKAKPSLFKGKKGDPGENAYLRFYNGWVQWRLGITGNWINLILASDLQGDSAYMVAVRNGFKGTEQEWLASLSAASESAARTALEAAKKVEDTNTLVTEAETGRVTAEKGRVTAEGKRVAAETVRVEAENKRATEEGKRVIVESSRVTAETSRVNVEKERVTAEQGRVSAESTRVTAEGKRVTEEEKRVSAESARVTAEGKRVTEEGKRAAAETTRVTEEGKRVTSETSRVEEEKKRVTAETGRKNAEAERVTAEGKRVIAETARQAATNEAVRNAEGATAAAQGATTNTITATEVAKELNEHQPKIQTGTWWVWNLNQKKYVDTTLSARGPQGKPLIVLDNGNYGFWDDNIEEYIDSNILAAAMVDFTKYPVEFTEATVRGNINSGEILPIILGKIKKWFSSLKALAFKDKVNYNTDIENIPVSLKNPSALTVSLNGTSQGAYDGSATKSIDITPTGIGAATSAHTHSYAGSSSAGGAATSANKVNTALTLQLNGTSQGAWDGSAAKTVNVTPAGIGAVGKSETNGGSVYTYTNLISWQNKVSSATGTIKINLPKGWTSEMFTVEIDLFQYNSNSAVKIIVSGYNYSVTPGWVNYRANVLGYYGYTIRLGYDSTAGRCCILLGATTSVFPYPIVNVSRVTVGHGSATGWNTSYTIEQITSESNITNIVTASLTTYSTFATTSNSEKRYTLTNTADAVVNYYLLGLAYNDTAISRTSLVGELSLVRGTASAAAKVSRVTIAAISAFTSNTATVLNVYKSGYDVDVVTLVYNSVKYLALRIGSTFSTTLLTFTGEYTKNGSNSNFQRLVDGIDTVSDVTVISNHNVRQLRVSDRINIDTTGRVTPAGTGTRRAGMYGVYDSSKIAHIWSMGTGYMIPDDGADFGNLYGLAYKHANNTTGGSMAGGHQMVWCENGSPKAALGTNGIWTSGGFLKTGSSNSYVLLGAGGHKLVSDFLASSGNAVSASKVTNALTLQFNGTSQTTYDGSVARTYNITPTAIGAATSSHTHSYLPLSGGTLTGRLINSTSNPSSWVSGMTTALIDFTAIQSQSSYHPYIRVKNYLGHVANIGGLGNQFGFYGYYNGRTDNGTDWNSYIDMSSGNWTHSKIFTAAQLKRSGSSDSYLLLGGGGHKAVSDFATKAVQKSATLATGTWTGSGPYSYVLSDSTVTASSFVTLWPAEASRNIAKEADIFEDVTTGSSTITIKATNKPSANISIKYTIEN